ncbi:MAG TPA: NAD(P)-dependent oxidoreductase [Bryobacteraceae bacterium]|jgi:3-hydroxyisobutyrate dehydrogenase/2-hydroxy-3-oxopropionate reductase|nr:NAD(P)-dependent oxidoreductase [Bryobacteraceae bacterium]
MAKLGFLGLGLMGYPMARNLIKAGHDVALWSNTADKAGKLATEVGGKVCTTPAEVAKHAECVFLCVGNSTMSEAVILGKDGVIEGAQKGSVVVDASTVSPSSSRHVGEELGKIGVDFLGAPCTGSTPGATNGTLTFMIGGDEKVFERVRPWFEVMGKKLYYCGGPGMGLHAKLTQNLVLANILQAFNEGIVLSTKAGMDPKLMLDILASSAAKSGLIDYKAPFIFRRDFETNFSVKWMHKDIGLMLDSAAELSVPLFLTSVTRQIFQAAIANGHGDEDICSTIKVLEEITGVEVSE